MAISFALKHGDSKEVYGKITFNGRFIFELNKNIKTDDWNKIGFVKLPLQSHRIESLNLFEHLNSRLPIPLRSETNEVKIKYIKATGLRVASDSFYLEEIRDLS